MHSHFSKSLMMCVNSDSNIKCNSFDIATLPLFIVSMVISDVFKTLRMC